MKTVTNDECDGFLMIDYLVYCLSTSHIEVIEINLLKENYHKIQGARLANTS